MSNLRAVEEPDEKPKTSDGPTYWEFRDAPGTVYLCERTGNTYRLSDYGTDWSSPDLEMTRPSYQQMHAHGFSRTHELPQGAKKIWSPA